MSGGVSLHVALCSSPAKHYYSSPFNLCQTVNVLMLIQVSGSAGRCQREWEAVNKEITYIHRVSAAVCQVAFEKMSS